MSATVTSLPAMSVPWYVRLACLTDPLLSRFPTTWMTLSGFRYLGHHPADVVAGLLVSRDSDQQLPGRVQDMAAICWARDQEERESGAHREREAG